LSPPLSHIDLENGFAPPDSDRPVSTNPFYGATPSIGSTPQPGSPRQFVMESDLRWNGTPD
jgi:hypothetical protein